MKLVMDACTVILLAKSSVLEPAAKTHDITLPGTVLNEVLAGIEKKLLDAMITRRLVESKILSISGNKNEKLRNRLMADFGMGSGEADSLALAMQGTFDSVATDNKQGRKAAMVNSIALVGSPEIIMALHKAGKISADKTRQALRVLKTDGWFNDVLIERLIEEVGKNA